MYLDCISSPARLSIYMMYPPLTSDDPSSGEDTLISFLATFRDKLEPPSQPPIQLCMPARTILILHFHTALQPSNMPTNPLMSNK